MEAAHPVADHHDAIQHPAIHQFAIHRAAVHHAAGQHAGGHHVGRHHVGGHHAAHHVGVHHHLPAAYPHSSPALSLGLGQENKHGQTSRSRPEQFFHDRCHSFSLLCLSVIST